MKIVFLDRETLPSRALQFDFEHELAEYDCTSPEETAARIADADVVICNKVVLGKREFAAAGCLKMVAVCATGYNNIDIEAAKAHGVTVCNVRAYGNESVAEHALMLILALMRGLPAYQRDVASGAWAQSPHFMHLAAPIRNVHGKTLAIFGRGNIGQTLAGYAEALGMTVLWGEHKNAETVREGYVSFEHAITQADVISLHCPLNDETRLMIGERELKAMKPQAVLVNCARGGLVDEQALVAALKYGHLGGAGFDVLTTEPPRDGNVLLHGLPNLIVTPHVAWASEESLLRMTQLVEENVNAFVAGKPKNVVV